LKFQLSTLLLIATIVGPGFGWFVDRTRLVRQHGHELETIENGATTISYARTTWSLTDDLINACPKVDRTIEKRLVMCVFRTWQNRIHVNSYFARRGTGYTTDMLVDDLLIALGCDDSDTFFAKARKMDIVEGNEDIFHEFFDQTSEDFVNLERFIASAIKDARGKPR
jgi:hypothetical protein